MLPFLIAILTFFGLSASAQTNQAKLFKKTHYVNGNFFRQTIDTIKVDNEGIDIYFFRRHFFSPYYLPERFIDKRYRNQRRSVWRDPNGKKDYQKNWENTYTYDSLGRVTNYTYSGCIICSNFPYNYTVTYNVKGQVEQLYNTINSKDRLKFYYNSKGNILKLEKYQLDKLETVVASVN